MPLTPSSLSSRAACTLAASCALTSVSQLQAEDHTDAELNNEQQPISITASRITDASGTSSQTQHQLSREDALRLGEHATTMDAVSRLPGVFTIGDLGGGIGGTKILSLRGTGNADTRLLVDGIPLTSPTTTNGQFNFAALPMSANAGTDVVKGVQPLYGSNAVGGVINQRSARPTATNEQYLRLEYGSFNQVLAQAEATGPIGNGFGYAVSLSAYDTDGISAQTGNADGDPSGYEDDSFTRLDGNARVQYDADWGQLHITVLAIDADNDFDAFLNPDSENENITNDTLRLAAGATLTPADAWDVQLDLALTNYDSIRTTGSPAVEAEVDGQDLYASARGVSRHIEQVTLSFGLDHLAQEADFGSREDDLSTTGIWGRAVYAQDAWEVDATLRGEFHSDSSDAVTWRLGTSYALWEDRSTLHASIGTGFRSPTMFELGDPNFGNTDLDPESSLAVELGHRTEVLTGLQLSNTFFHTEFTDRIGFDPATFVTINVDGDSQIQGLESSLSWEPESREVLLTINHTYVDAKDPDDETPTYKPRNTASFASTYYWLDRQVWGTLSVDWIDSYKVFGGEIDDRTLVGLALGWHIDERFTVYSRVRNLFDEVYQPNTGFSGEPLNAVLGASASF